jgi:hypothetical protein
MDSQLPLLSLFSPEHPLRDFPRYRPIRREKERAWRQTSQQDLPRFPDLGPDLREMSFSGLNKCDSRKYSCVPDGSLLGSVREQSSRRGVVVLSGSVFHLPMKQHQALLADQRMWWRFPTICAFKRLKSRGGRLTTNLHLDPEFHYLRSELP